MPRTTQGQGALRCHPLLCIAPMAPSPPNAFLSHCSIAAESARAVAAAEGQVRALELEASDAKRDAGKRIACKQPNMLPPWVMACVSCAGKMQATLRQTERQLLRLQVGPHTHLQHARAKCHGCFRRSSTRQGQMLALYRRVAAAAAALYHLPAAQLSSSFRFCSLKLKSTG